MCTNCCKFCLSIARRTKSQVSAVFLVTHITVLKLCLLRFSEHLHALSAEGLYCK